MFNVNKILYGHCQLFGSCTGKFHTENIACTISPFWQLGSHKILTKGVEAAKLKRTSFKVVKNNRIETEKIEK